MTRPLVPVIAALVLSWAVVLGASRPAHAQPAAAAPSALPAPTPTPRPRRRLLVQGRQFISLGVSPATRVSSEFRPGSTAARPGFDLWQSGEVRVFGISFTSFNDYREIAYDHVAAEPVTTVGGAGSTFVPAFVVHDWSFENGGGIRVASHVYAGIAFLNRQENTGYPALHAIGYSLVVAPNAAPLITPYGWLTYYGNLGGKYTLPDQLQTALTYRGLRYRAGVLFAEPGSHFYFDAGVDGESLLGRTNAPSDIHDFGLRLGLGVRL